MFGRLLIERVEIAAHRRHGLVIGVTTPLDHRRVTDAEAEDETIVIEAGQRAQPASRGERVACIDIRNGAADDEPLRIRQHEARDGEGFISERFRVPERRIAKVFNRPQQAFDPR